MYQYIFYLAAALPTNIQMEGCIRAEVSLTAKVTGHSSPTMPARARFEGVYT